MSRTLPRAGAFALAFLVVYAAAVLTPLGQQLDAASLGAFPWLPAAAHQAAGPLRIGLVIAAVGVSVLVLADLLLKRRFALAARAVATGVATMLAVELLKRLVLPRPYFGQFGYAQNTFPSGHVAFTAVVAAVVLRVAPAWFARRWQRSAVVAVVAVAALAEPVSFAHRASDAVGGLLIAGIAVALLWPARVRGIPRVAVVAVALVVAAIALAELMQASVLLGAAIAALLAAASLEVVAPELVTARRLAPSSGGPRRDLSRSH